MHNIDNIMAMLDWKNSVLVQEEGVELAKSINSINVFILPAHEGCNKNVWDNCAKILYRRSDEVLKPYLMQLLEWLEDLNWPGALTILERLKQYTDAGALAFALNESIKRAIAMNKEIWLCNLSDLLDNKNLVSVLPKDALSILQDHRNNL